MDIGAIRDAAIGSSLYQPCRSVAAVELVRVARSDEPAVAGLLEGPEVPVGILNVGTVDLVPLHGASGICFDEPGSFGVDGILEVVAGERYPPSAVCCTPTIFRSLMSPVGRRSRRTVPSRLNRASTEVGSCWLKLVCKSFR